MKRNILFPFVAILVFAANMQLNAKTGLEIKASVNLYLAIENSATHTMLTKEGWQDLATARQGLEEKLNEIFSNSGADIQISLCLEETTLNSPATQSNATTLNILVNPSTTNQKVLAIRKAAIKDATEPADIIGLLNLTSSGSSAGQANMSGEARPSDGTDAKLLPADSNYLVVNVQKAATQRGALAQVIAHEMGHIMGLAHECSNPNYGSSVGIAVEAHGYDISHDGDDLAHTVMSYGKTGSQQIDYFSNPSISATDASIYQRAAPRQIPHLVPSYVKIGEEKTSSSACAADAVSVLNRNKMNYQNFRVATPKGPNGKCSIPGEGGLKKVVASTGDNCGGEDGCIGTESCGEMDNCMSSPSALCLGSNYPHKAAHVSETQSPLALLWKDYQSRLFSIPNSATGTNKRYILNLEYIVSCADVSLSGQSTPIKQRLSYYDSDIILQCELYINGRLLAIVRELSTDIEVETNNASTSHPTTTALIVLIDSGDKVELVVKAGKL